MHPSVADNNAQNRRVDIIVISKSKDRGLVPNATVHWKTNDSQPDCAVDEEKYLRTMHSMALATSTTSWEVFGLWFGVWDTASGFLKSFFRLYKFATDDLVCLF